MAYLDDTGLAYFWGKIKAYIAALLAPKADDSDVVHKTGTETVGGDKTFTSRIIVRSDSSITCQDSDGYLVIYADKDGGGSSVNTQGAKFALAGPASDGAGNYNSGRFALIARNSANACELTGFASGDLVWQGSGIYLKRDGWNCYKNKQSGISSFKNYSTNIGWLGIHQVTANDNSIISSLDVRYNGTYTDLSFSAAAADADGRTISVILTVNKAYSEFNFRPNHNGTYNLGTGGYRWKQLFAATTTISTSDRRRKESIDSIPDAVLDAWDAVDWVQFKFSSSVAEKGQESARLHSGVIAQDIGEAFSGFGLDASRYGFFCYDRWDAEEASYDGDGNLKTEAREAGDAYSIRYEEALCMEAAYMRRENARLKKRIADLEDRLAALELKVS